MINSIEIAGLTIGGFDSGFLFSKLGGFGFPEVRVDVQDRGNYHGAVLSTHNYGRRSMTVEGTIYGESLEDFENKRRAIEAAVGYNNGLKTVIFNTRAGLSVQAEAIISSAIDLPYKSGDVTQCEFRLELVAPYPFLLSEIEKTESVYIFSGGGGAMPAALPYAMATGGSGAAVIANDGNGDAYPVINIYGSITTPSITNEAAGKSLSINYAVGVGEYIEVDMYNRTVLLNGSVNILQYVSGDWWAIQPGDNTIKLTASANDGSARADLIYRDAYL